MQGVQVYKPPYNSNQMGVGLEGISNQSAAKQTLTRLVFRASREAVEVGGVARTTLRHSLRPVLPLALSPLCRVASYR